MNRKHYLAIGLALLGSAGLPPADARTIWTGPKITFTKGNGTDPTQSANQDRLTDTVWITRGNTRGIYNAAEESGYTSTSPAGTEWAFGTTANIDSLTFSTWVAWNGGRPDGPPTMVGRDAVLHLITEDIYIDIRFTSWTQGGGGGFAYSRSTPPAVSAPQFTQHPQPMTVDLGADVSFVVAVTGMPAPTLQWQKDGQPLVDETAATLNLAAVTLEDAGSYACVATNSEGSVTSDAATLTVNPPPAPQINVDPEAMTSLIGTGAFFSIQASGEALSYQWRKDGADLVGETGSTLFLDDVTVEEAGSYDCVVSNAGGNATSASASLTVVSEGGARLANLSARAVVGTGDNLLIPGFVLGGGGATGLLVRGVGPTLEDLGVTDVLSDPQIRVFRTIGTDSQLVGENDSWTDNEAELTPVFDQLGAFELTSSLDTAVLFELESGSYTAQLSGVNEATGVGLVEIYALNGSASGSLANLSARAQVGTGGNILIPGFVIEGDVAMTLLIRGVGPTLASDFGVVGVLEDPVMTLFRDGVALATNDEWEQAPNQPALIAATANTGAFELGTGQSDAAFLVALNPGAYTVQLEGKDGGTGVALVELFVVGP